MTNYKKFISVMVIIAFLLYGSTLLPVATNNRQETKKTADKNYRKANDREAKPIAGVNQEDLKADQKKSESTKKNKAVKKKKVVEKKGDIKKKKFPWLLVAGGVVVASVVLYFLLKKKPKYDLTVTVGEGVTGSPSSGTTTYKKGETVSYSYSLQPGYSDLQVKLDGNQVAANGTITMGQEHTLSAASSANQPGFVTNTDEVTVPEGGTASFKVKLSEQPAADIDATVEWKSGDNDITVQSGTSLTFTTTNWNSYQTVTLAAAEDDDADDDTATIRISAQGMNNKDITAVENDLDRLLTVTAPNGGEKWKIGSHKKITWTANGITDSLTIALYKYGSHYGDIAVNIDPGMGYYDWYVGKLNDGTTVPPSNGYQIRITSVDRSDMSDGYFTILE